MKRPTLTPSRRVTQLLTCSEKRRSRRSLKQRTATFHSADSPIFTILFTTSTESGKESRIQQCQEASWYRSQLAPLGKPSLAQASTPLEDHEVDLGGPILFSVLSIFAASDQLKRSLLMEAHRKFHRGPLPRFQLHRRKVTEHRGADSRLRTEGMATLSILFTHE